MTLMHGPKCLRIIEMALILLVSACSAVQHPAPRRSVQALYAPALRVSASEITNMVEVATRTQANALVVDIKDADGVVNLREAADVPLVTLRSAERAIDTRRLVRAAHERGWYLIARIAVLLDGCLARQHPEWVVRNERGEAMETGNADCGPARFISPYRTEAWNYALALAQTAVRAGFDEIQLDYIRFPDEEVLQVPDKNQDDRARSEVIAAGVARIRRGLASRIPLSLDVFGAVAFGAHETIGQDLVKLAPYADYLCPMLYPSLWVRDSLGVADPSRMPYEIILRATQEIQAQLAPSPLGPTYDLGSSMALGQAYHTAARKLRPSSRGSQHKRCLTGPCGRPMGFTPRKTW